MELKYKYDQNLERKTTLTRPITRKKERETRKKGNVEMKIYIKEVS